MSAEHNKVFRKTEIVGTSNASLEDAVNRAIERAKQTLRHLRWFEVTEQRGAIYADRLEFQATIGVGFELEDEGSSWTLRAPRRERTTAPRADSAFPVTNSRTRWRPRPEERVASPPWRDDPQRRACPAAVVDANGGGARQVARVLRAGAFGVAADAPRQGDVERYEDTAAERFGRWRTVGH